jgi:hypothetical protein
MKAVIEGGCLCGAVRFSLKNQFAKFYLCHCSQCRKITGSSNAANLFTSPQNIEWLSGQTGMKRHDYPGRGFTSVFCTECGSGLPFLSKSGKALIVPAGCLNDEPNIAPQANIFWAERAAWFEPGVSAEHCDGFPT